MSVTSFANIFFHSVGCLCILFVVCYAKCFKFDLVPQMGNFLFTFLFLFIHLGESSFLSVDPDVWVVTYSSAWRIFFHISCSARLLVISQFLSVWNVFISPLFLKDIFVKYKILGWYFQHFKGVIPLSSVLQSFGCEACYNFRLFRLSSCVCRLFPVLFNIKWRL